MLISDEEISMMLRDPGSYESWNNIPRMYQRLRLAETERDNHRATVIAEMKLSIKLASRLDIADEIMSNCSSCSTLVKKDV